MWFLQLTQLAAFCSGGSSIWQPCCAGQQQVYEQRVLPASGVRAARSISQGSSSLFSAPPDSRPDGNQELLPCRVAPASVLVLVPCFATSEFLLAPNPAPLRKKCNLVYHPRKPASKSPKRGVPRLCLEGEVHWWHQHRLLKSLPQSLPLVPQLWPPRSVYSRDLAGSSCHFQTKDRWGRLWWWIFAGLECFLFVCLFVFCILFGNSLRTTEAQVPQFGDPGTDGTSQLPPRAGSQGQKCFDGWLSHMGVHAMALSVQQSHKACVKLEQQLCSEINLSVQVLICRYF